MAFHSTFAMACAREAALAAQRDTMQIRNRYSGEVVQSISGSSLREADLENKDLIEANLADADLRFANLRNACLIAAVLRNADLTGANLCGADLSNAVLHNAILKDVLYNDQTTWPAGFSPLEYGAVYQEPPLAKKAWWKFW